MYYWSSPLTFTGLRIRCNQGKCSDTQNKDHIGEKIDEVDQATEGLPFVVEETSYKRMLQQIQSLMLNLSNGTLYYALLYTIYMYLC